MSARSSCAPRPMYTGNPAPVILVPRAKSMIPSFSINSQCGLSVKSAAGSSPQVATARLSAGVVPGGTLAWGMLGIRRSAARRFSSRTPRAASSVLISSATERISAMSAEASSPLDFILATSADTVFRRLLSVSTFCSTPRRCSSAASASSTGDSSSPFSRTPALTSTACSRMYLMSSIVPVFSVFRGRAAARGPARCRAPSVFRGRSGS